MPPVAQAAPGGRRRGRRRPRRRAGSGPRPAGRAARARSSASTCPSPTSPTIATKLAALDAQRDAAQRLDRASPPGRRYVLPISCSSIIVSTPHFSRPRLRRRRTHGRPRAARRRSRQCVSSRSCRLTRRASLARRPARTQAGRRRAARRARGSASTLSRVVERDPHRGRHLRAQGALARRVEGHDRHVVDDVVADLGLRVDRRQRALELVVGVGVDREARVLARADAADVGLVHVGPDLEPREVDQRHERRARRGSPPRSPPPASRPRRRRRRSGP